MLNPLDRRLYLSGHAAMCAMAEAPCGPSGNLSCLAQCSLLRAVSSYGGSNARINMLNTFHGWVSCPCYWSDVFNRLQGVKTPKVCNSQLVCVPMGPQQHGCKPMTFCVLQRGCAMIQSMSYTHVCPHTSPCTGTVGPGRESNQ